MYVKSCSCQSAWQNINYIIQLFGNDINFCLIWPSLYLLDSLLQEVCIMTNWKSVCFDYSFSTLAVWPRGQFNNSTKVLSTAGYIWIWLSHAYLPEKVCLRKRHFMTWSSFWVVIICRNSLFSVVGQRLRFVCFPQVIFLWFVTHPSIQSHKLNRFESSLSLVDFH